MNVIWGVCGTDKFRANFKQKLFSKLDEISQPINKSCFSCQNIGQILIWMILVVSKCSIYDVKHPIFLIFRGSQTPRTATIFEKISGTILFYENKSACHIFGTICDTFRIPIAFAVNHVHIIIWRNFQIETLKKRQCKNQ